MDLSIIVPVHNEATRLASSIKRLETLLKTHYDSYEIIITEDGSQDDSYEIAQNIAKTNKRVRVLHATARLGKGKALTGAILHSKGKIIGFVDADLAADIRRIPDLVATVNKTGGIAVGSRLIGGVYVNRPWSRKISSKVYNRFVQVLFKTEIKDHQCGLKVFSKQVINHVAPALGDSQWAWDTEFLVNAKQAGYHITEIPIAWQNPPESTPILKVLKLGSIMLYELLLFKLRRLAS